MRSDAVHPAGQRRRAVGEESLRYRAVVLAIIFAVGSGCTSSTAPAVKEGAADSIAERYVKLVLAVGQHDENYVDAFYGPAESREEARAANLSLARIAEDIAALRSATAALPPPSSEMEGLRHAYLARQLESMAARVEMLQGRKFTFDEESRALYDAVSPHHDDAYYQRILDQIDRLLPGAGTTAERVEAFTRKFIVPPAKMDAAMRVALEACRDRTRAHIALPPGESFTVEYVRDKPWAGYNWYQGNYKSLIQVNVSGDTYVNKVLDLACHEGYPGHHLYNSLLEQKLVRERGWVEFTVYPLNSPQSLIAEGTGNYGLDVAFPGPQRSQFEREVLFPLLGLDGAEADRYYRLVELQRQLSYAVNDAARNYLDGHWSAEQTVEWMTRYSLYTPDRARRQLRFIDTYRSYVINYNLGRDLVRASIERRAGDDPAARWREFAALISSPRLPSSLR